MATPHIKNLLLQTKIIAFNQKRLWLLFVLIVSFQAKAQVANYISNGSFEESSDCNWPNQITKAKHWLSIDSTSFAGNYLSACPNYDLVPQNGSGFQYARSGIAYAGTTMFIITQLAERGYLKNRLKKNLQAGKEYCVKFYISISNSSSYGMDGFGIYFGNATLDTITKCNVPLTYITPQVQNPSHNIITDTLNWVEIKGTFVANGSEKYAVIGNFKANNSLDTLLINSTNLPIKFTDVLIDDVSCIPVDLPAFAGHDTTYVTGPGTYIGRPRDVGIDEACTWYKLPVVITPTTPAIDTAAGMFVSPVETSTYVVRQDICGNVKWDTVVVYKDWVGLHSINKPLNQLSMYPNPASQSLTFNYIGTKEDTPFTVSMINTLGQQVLQEEFVFKQGSSTLNLNLPAGVYSVIISSNGHSTHKKLIIAN